MANKPITKFLIFIMLTAAAHLFSEEYTLEKYIKLVQSNNKDIMLAASGIKLANENEKMAKSQALPTIGFQSGLDRNFIDIEQPVAVASRPGGGPLIYKDIDVNKDYNFSFGLGLQQNIFNMNVLNAIKASKEYRQMSQSVFDIQNEAIITAAKKVFFQCYLLEKFYQIKKDTEEKTHEHYLEMKKKYETGLVSKLNFLNAEVDWKMAIPKTTNAKMNMDLCLINLKTLAGIDLKEEIKIIGDFSVYPDMPEVLELKDVIEERSDYKALVKEKNLRELNIKATQSNHFPTLALDATYGYSAAEDKISKSLTDNDNSVFKIGLKLTLPIYAGGAMWAADRKVKTEAEQTNIKLLQKREEIISELHRIYLTLQEEFENIEMAAATLDTAKQAYDIAKASFNNGLMTQLELRDVRIQLESAELNRISSVYNYLSAYFDWQKATGNMAL